MAIDPIEGVATPSSNYEKYKDRFDNSDKDLITMDSFYQLLVAEMQNQDPLEPTSNTEFISQMASFTALQAQQDAFDVQEQQYANSLVGKTVTVKSGQDTTVTGTVTSVAHSSGGSPQLMVEGKSYAMSSLMEVHADETTASASTGSVISDYGSFATGLLGKDVFVQTTNADGSAVLDQGTVDSLEIQNGIIRLIINGYAYDVTDVVRVAQPEETADNGYQYYYAAQDDIIPVNYSSGYTSTVNTAGTGTANNSGSDDTANYIPAAENNTSAAEQVPIREDSPYITETQEEDIPDLVEIEAENNMLRQLFE